MIVSPYCSRGGTGGCPGNSRAGPHLAAAMRMYARRLLAFGKTALERVDEVASTVGDKVRRLCAAAIAGIVRPEAGAAAIRPRVRCIITSVTISSIVTIIIIVTIVLSIVITVDSVAVDSKGMSARKEFMIQEQHEVNMRPHHEYYSRIEGGHGARDIVGAHNKPKAAVEANTD